MGETRKGEWERKGIGYGEGKCRGETLWEEEIMGTGGRTWERQVRGHEDRWVMGRTGERS